MKDFRAGLLARQFEELEFYLDCEFNLLVYGVGSKRKTLNRFAERVVMPQIIVNGYHAATTIKSVLNKISEFIEELL